MGYFARWDEDRLLEEGGISGSGAIFVGICDLAAADLFR